MLEKNPERRISVPQMKVGLSAPSYQANPSNRPVCCGPQVHPWVTSHGAEPLPPEDDRCCVLIEVTEEEVENSVKHVPSLATVVSCVWGGMCEEECGEEHDEECV